MIQDPTGQWIPWGLFCWVAGLWVSEEKSQKQDDVRYVYNVKVLARERYRRCGANNCFIE